MANDEESYRYLAESIRKHPPQEELAEMMREAGFSQVNYRNLTGGVVLQVNVDSSGAFSGGITAEEWDRLAFVIYDQDMGALRIGH